MSSRTGFQTWLTRLRLCGCVMEHVVSVWHANYVLPQCGRCLLWDDALSIWHWIWHELQILRHAGSERSVKVYVYTCICKNVLCDMCNKRTTGMWSVPGIICFPIVWFWFPRWDATTTSWMRATKVSSMYIPIGRSNKDPYFAMDDVVFMSLNLNYKPEVHLSLNLEIAYESCCKAICILSFIVVPTCIFYA